MLFLSECSFVSNAVNGEGDGLSALSGTAVNIRFTELVVAVEIRANAVSGGDSLITFPEIRAADVNMSCCICTVNIGDASESDILSRTAYNLG